TQGTNIVESHDVVRVRVRVDDRVKATHSGAQCLLAKIGRGINQHHTAAIFHQDGRTCALVVRIGGSTNLASAAQCGHSHGSSAAQNGESCFHFLPPAAGVPGGGVRVMALVNSRNAMRSSKSVCCKSVCSALVRLPLVFSLRIPSVSIVC